MAQSVNTMKPERHRWEGVGPQGSARVAVWSVAMSATLMMAQSAETKLRGENVTMSYHRSRRVGKNETTFARVLEQVAKEIGRRRAPAQPLDVQLAAWEIVARHRGKVEIGIELRSFTDYVVMEIFKAEAAREEDK